MKYDMPPGMTRRRVHGLRIFTAGVVLLMAYLTFVMLEAGQYAMTTMNAVITALNMNGYVNFTKILQANPK